jgi:GNAT superfamily N-acetyltransferase
MRTRLGIPDDAPMLAALISLAYRVEDFFKVCDRADAAEIREKMSHGAFIVLEDGDGVAGCVYVTVQDGLGYFGMLAVDPSRQRQGLGAILIAGAEDYCRRAGCREIEIEVVNLRTELPPFYRRFGYTESGTRPFVDIEKTSRPCHSIVMSKHL